MLHFIVPGNSDHENEGEIILSRERERERESREKDNIRQRIQKSNQGFYVLYLTLLVNKIPIGQFCSNNL